MTDAEVALFVKPCPCGRAPRVEYGVVICCTPLRWWNRPDRWWVRFLPKRLRCHTLQVVDTHAEKAGARWNRMIDTGQG